MIAESKRRSKKKTDEGKLVRLFSLAVLVILVGVIGSIVGVIGVGTAVFVGIIGVAVLAGGIVIIFAHDGILLSTGM